MPFVRVTPGRVDVQLGRVCCVCRVCRVRRARAREWFRCWEIVEFGRCVLLLL